MFVEIISNNLVYIIDVFLCGVRGESHLEMELLL